MKILFENYALDATITSTDYSTNYPPSNLIHPFLRKRYQNIGGDDTITVTFAADKTINSIYLGYHNADETELLVEDGDTLTTEDDSDILVSTATVNYVLYNYANANIGSGTLTMANQFEAIHFTAVTFVRKVVITLQWAGKYSNGYLGGIGIGNSMTMPYFNTGWENGFTDNSPVSSSLTGQVLQNYIEPQDVKKFNWSGVDSDVFYAIKAAAKNTGKGKPVWVDYYEESHDIIQPIYATINGIDGATRTERLYDFSMTFTEAR